MPPLYVVTANVRVVPSPVYDLVIYLSAPTPPLPVTTKSPSTLALPSIPTLNPDTAAVPIPICSVPEKVSILISPVFVRPNSDHAPL